MKLTGNGETITTNVAQDRIRKCGVKAGAAAWKIMTDNLYAFKERAIIRELSTNCIDSLRKAGKPLNEWSLTIPNSSSNLLIFEDNGIGMDDSDIDIYTTLFDSTKSDSNDETGMFGLGAKTPFAYTKQFFVESSKNGQKNIYDIHIAEDGCPDCIKINPEPIPTDKTGTKITLTVKSQDFSKFYDGIIFSAATWPELPTLKGAEEFYYYLKRDFEFECSGEEAFKATNAAYKSGKVIRSKEIYTVGNTFSLEMGSVLYKISQPYNFDVPSDVRYIIHADIGDVDIQPSREELQYSDKTMKYLESAMPSVFVNAIDVPHIDEGFKVIDAFFDKQETRNVLFRINREILNETAQKKYDEIIALQTAYNNKVNEFESHLSDTTIISERGWSVKFDTNPFAAVLFVNTDHVSKNSLALKMLSAPFTYSVIILNLSEKDKRHLKVKEGSYIDAAYFLPKIRSLQKEQTNPAKTVFIFSDSDFTTYIKSDDWFGLKDASVYEFSELKNTYAPVETEPKKRTKDAWKEVKTWNFSCFGSGWEKCEQGFNRSYAELETYIKEADKLLMFPLFRNDAYTCNMEELKTTPFKDISSLNIGSPTFSFFHESDEKIIVLSGPVAAIVNCKLFDLGWSSVFSYAAKFLIEKRKSVIGTSFKGQFYFHRIFEKMPQSMKEALNGTTFIDCLEKYEEYAKLYSVRNDNLKYFGNDRYFNFEPEYSTLRDLSNKFENNDDSDANEAENCYKTASEKYPLLSLFEEHMRFNDWTYRYWSSEAPYSVSLGPRFVDYIKMIDAQ